MALVVMVPLDHRLNSCGSGAQLLHSMWHLPGPRVEPMSPALASRFVTTEPAGKKEIGVLIKLILRTRMIFQW